LGEAAQAQYLETAGYTELALAEPLLQAVIICERENPLVILKTALLAIFDFVA
jgi:hypothetical protein